MIGQTVYNAVVTTLSNNPTLAKYMKYVFKGFRYDIEPDSMPCLMVEPISNNELHKDANQYSDLYLNLDIVGLTYNMHSPEKSIVGDADNKGVMDIEQDVKACLQSSYTLGDKVIDIVFETSIYDRVDIVGKYPVRGVSIPIKVLYRQNNSI